MTLAKRIANIIFDAGIRLDDEGSLCSIYQCDEDMGLKVQIAAEVLSTTDIEVVVNTTQIDPDAEDIEKALAMSLLMAAYEHARDRLTEDVDEQLWQFQLQEKSAAKEDAAYEEYKSRDL